eukprot:CAMPEP_0170612700 /NCGR_PEP_ID=MMETSP0224-20130122/23866_1 /TAXON_ID=285029 /ORGANISM="Togula jolla, Strain CCCM 725" /LENGTH=271 /DNA_ID=CAMNT_0010938227 /DNA_START=66 /DNA_END=881 /DNA_ORIENTATION=-
MGAAVSEEARKTIVVVGMTGTGKSTTCNLITNSRVFHEDTGFESATAEIAHKDVMSAGMPIRVIDTVGFMSTGESEQTRDAKFAQFADLASYGVDIFLFTEKYGRFTEVNEQNFLLFKELVGPEALRHTLFLFTHVTNQRLQQEIQKGQVPQSLQAIMCQVGGIVGIDSKANPRLAVADLRSAMAELVKRNSELRYSNESLSAAAERREALQKKIDAIPIKHVRDILTQKRRGLSNGTEIHEDVERAVQEAQASGGKCEDTTCCGGFATKF